MKSFPSISHSIFFIYSLQVPLPGTDDHGRTVILIRTGEKWFIPRTSRVIFIKVHFQRNLHFNHCCPCHRLVIATWIKFMISLESSVDKIRQGWFVYNSFGRKAILIIEVLFYQFLRLTMTIKETLHVFKYLWNAEHYAWNTRHV